MKKMMTVFAAVAFAVASPAAVSAAAVSVPEGIGSTVSVAGNSLVAWVTNPLAGAEAPGIVLGLAAMIAAVSLIVMEMK